MDINIIVSGLVGALVAYVGAILKDIVSSRSKLNASLLKERMALYAELWALTEAVPMWPRNEALTVTELKEYSRCIARWYFQKGGLLLSRAAQSGYVALQSVIWHVIEKQKEGKVDATDYKSIHHAGSNLRTALTADLHSRKASPYG